MGKWMITARKIGSRVGGLRAVHRGRRTHAAMRAIAARCVRRIAIAAKGGADRGMSTAEYAMGTLAACGFAVLLHRVVTGTEIQEVLMNLIHRALSVAG